MTPYSNYKGRSVGRIVHYIYLYCGINIGEYCQIGDGTVLYGGKTIATFTWENEGDDSVPNFTFLNSLDLFGSEVVNDWRERQYKIKPFAYLPTLGLNVEYVIQEVAKEYYFDFETMDEMAKTRMREAGRWWEEKDIQKYFPHIRDCAKYEALKWENHSKWLQEQNISGPYLIW